MDRKSFLKVIGSGSLAAALAPNMMMAEELKFNPFQSENKLTILHTNDQHSRIEPFDAS
jgi:5'-nucleotidase